MRTCVTQLRRYVATVRPKRPAATVERLVEAWKRAGSPPAELPTDDRER